jgi:hypothetical protein
MAGLGFGRGLSPILISRLFLASTRSNDTLTLVVWHVHLRQTPQRTREGKVQK